MKFWKTNSSFLLFFLLFLLFLFLLFLFLLLLWLVIITNNSYRSSKRINTLFSVDEQNTYKPTGPETKPQFIPITQVSSLKNTSSTILSKQNKHKIHAKGFDQNFMDFENSNMKSRNDSVYSGRQPVKLSQNSGNQLMRRNRNNSYRSKVSQDVNRKNEFLDENSSFFSKKSQSK